jgi:hypothetical protein
MFLDRSIYTPADPLLESEERFITTFVDGSIYNVENS